MTTVKFILRLVWIPIAFALSACTAAFVMFVIGQERLIQWVHSRPGGGSGDDVIGAIELARAGIDLVFSLASGATVLPALALVIVGEVARIRSWLYYVLGGGVALAVIPVLARFGQAAGAASGPPAAIWQLFATAGFAAGFVYWLLAGRRA